MNKSIKKCRKKLQTKSFSGDRDVWGGSQSAKPRNGVWSDGGPWHLGPLQERDGEADQVVIVITIFITTIFLLTRATPELILNTTTLLLDKNKLTRLDNIHTYQCLEKVPFSFSSKSPIVDSRFVDSDTYDVTSENEFSNWAVGVAKKLLVDGSGVAVVCFFEDFECCGATRPVNSRVFWLQISSMGAFVLNENFKFPIPCREHLKTSAWSTSRSRAHGS